MIVTTKNTCGGYPRIDGTRIEVFNIIDCLSDGMSIDEISKYYKNIEQESSHFLSVVMNCSFFMFYILYILV